MNRVVSRAQSVATGSASAAAAAAFSDCNGKSAAANFASKAGSSGNGLRAKGPIGSHSDRVTASTVSEDGSVAVTGSADHEVKVWDLRDGAEVCVLIGHEAAITTLAMSSRKALLATGDEDGVINLWDGQSFEHLMTLNAWYKLRVTAMTFAELTVMDHDIGRAGRRNVLVAACSDGRCKIWYCDNG